MRAEGLPRGYLGCQPARACGCTHGEDRVACTHMHPSSNLPIHIHMLLLLIHTREGVLLRCSVIAQLSQCTGAIE